MASRFSFLPPLLLLVSAAATFAPVSACSSDDGATAMTSDAGAASTDGGDASTSPPNGTDGSVGDAAPPVDADGSTSGDGGGVGGGDAGAVGSAGPCPTGRKEGAINTPGGACFTFTPTATGADPAGENADSANYAISPDSGAIGKLLLFFNGSGGHPFDEIADPSKNFYNAAAAQGYQVLAVSYRSDESVGAQCSCTDACFFPTRETLIRGVYQAGASAELQVGGDGGVGAIRVDESIAGRTALALRWLVASDAAHDWSQYLTSAAPSAPPETQIEWTKVVVAGHSQGGGHAAAIGKLFPVVRVIQLSSTCDTVTSPDNCNRAGGNPLETTNSTWLSRSNGTWATPATSYWGLDSASVFDDAGSYVSGDPVCFTHASGWMSEGVPASQQDDDEATCGATKSTLHDQSIGCEDNFGIWTTMLKP